jgi:transmembrane sensor
MTEATDQTPNLPSGLDPLTDQALDWVLLLRSGRATIADAAALNAWRQQSPEHEEAFRAAARLWRDLRTVAAEFRTDDQIVQLSSRRPLARIALSRRALIGGAVAASAAAFAALRPPLGLWPSIKELSADYRTGKGERRDVKLADGVTLKLNTQTSVAVRSLEREAEIELISGEAAITAARPPSSPLVVTAAGGRLIATRATFDARCFDDAVVAACIDGLVVVEQGARRIELRRGEQASYSATRILDAPVAANTVQATAWQEGLLIFHNRPLAEVIDEVNRYRPGKIIIINPQLAQRVVDGTFHLDRLEDVVAQVRQLFDARVRRLPGGIVLLG